jgi:hypothetical protein
MTANENKLMWIASIDIGSKNFAFYVEEIDVIVLSKIKNISISERYNADGTPTVKMNNILKTIFKDGKTIIHKNVDLTGGCSTGKYLDQNILHNLTNLLDKHFEIWDKCFIFLVEQQMSFGKKINLKAIKIGQHVQSYFLFRYGKFKTVIEFPSYHKTNILGSEKINKGQTKSGKIKYKNIDKPARKKWSIEKAKEILLTRGETNHPLLTSKRGSKGHPSIKKDDLADTLTMLAAFKYLHFVDLIY